MEIVWDVLAILFIAVLFYVYVWVWVVLYRKAGYNRWWGLLALLPPANIFLLLALAGGNWPIHREILRLKLAVGEEIGQKQMRELVNTGFDLFNKGDLVQAEKIFCYVIANASKKTTVEEARKMLAVIGHTPGQGALPPPLP